jgi:hypothetical protein
LKNGKYENERCLSRKKNEANMLGSPEHVMTRVKHISKTEVKKRNKTQIHPYIYHLHFLNLSFIINPTKIEVKQICFVWRRKEKDI